MAQDFRKTVKDLVLRFEYRRLAEIGVWRGELSRILWSLPSTEYLLMVDSFNSGCTGMTEKLTQEEMNEIRIHLSKEKPPNTKMMVMPSITAAKFVPEKSLDFVFIDALHTYESCRADIEAWLPKIREGGMIAGDDYSVRFMGVIKAVGEMLPYHVSNGRVWSCQV